MILFFSLLFSDFSSVQSMLDKQEASGHVVDEHLKDQMAAVHSQVWLNYGFFESYLMGVFSYRSPSTYAIIVFPKNIANVLRYWVQKIQVKLFFPRLRYFFTPVTLFSSYSPQLSY